MSIDFALDADQQALQSTVRSLFEAAGGLGLARTVMEDRRGYSRELWRQMADLDLAGLAIPASHGGSGGSLLDLYALYSEMGRALVSSPHLASSVLAARMLDLLGTEAHKRQWLPAMAGGDALLVPAVLEPSGVWDAGGVEATLRADAGTGGLRLDGTKVLVPYADGASRLVVAAREGGSESERERGSEGVSAVLVDPAAAGVSLHPEDNLAGLSLFVVQFDGVQVDVAHRLGPPGAAWPAIADAFARGAVLRCAEIAAAGERMRDMAVDYAQQRVQFGTPIGRHQAVQYLCTDVAMESHLTGLLAKRAAWLLDHGPAPEAALAVSTAKRYASRAAHHMAQQAHEVFAGVAFMMEHDLHLFTRHAKHWEHDLGDVRHHGELIVQALEAAAG